MQYASAKKLGMINGGAISIMGIPEKHMFQDEVTFIGARSLRKCTRWLDLNLFVKYFFNFLVTKSRFSHCYSSNLEQVLVFIRYLTKV